MASTARVHLLQIELGGPKPKLHGTIVREIEDGADNVEVGSFDIEIELTATEVKPLLDKAKAEVARRAALPEAPEDEKKFKGIAIQ
jgi:hypothetical protein